MLGMKEMQMVDLQGSTVMCRQVALHSEADLRTVSVTAAKAIIILADSEVASDASDAQVSSSPLEDNHSSAAAQYAFLMGDSDLLQDKFLVL